MHTIFEGDLQSDTTIKTHEEVKTKRERVSYLVVVVEVLKKIK